MPSVVSPTPSCRVTAEPGRGEGGDESPPAAGPEPGGLLGAQLEIARANGGWENRCRPRDREKVVVKERAFGAGGDLGGGAVAVGAR